MPVLFAVVLLNPREPSKRLPARVPRVIVLD